MEDLLRTISLLAEPRVVCRPRRGDSCWYPFVLLLENKPSRAYMFPALRASSFKGGSNPLTTILLLEKRSFKFPNPTGNAILLLLIWWRRYEPHVRQGGSQPRQVRWHLFTYNDADLDLSCQ
jgi:hypothetical protein